jgi:hypothetical protein
LETPSATTAAKTAKAAGVLTGPTDVGLDLLQVDPHVSTKSDECRKSRYLTLSAVGEGPTVVLGAVPCQIDGENKSEQDTTTAVELAPAVRDLLARVRGEIDVRTVIASKTFHTHSVLNWLDDQQLQYLVRKPRTPVDEQVIEDIRSCESAHTSVSPGLGDQSELNHSITSLYAPLQTGRDTGNERSGGGSSDQYFAVSTNREIGIEDTEEVLEQYLRSIALRIQRSSLRTIVGTGEHAEATQITGSPFQGAVAIYNLWQVLRQLGPDPEESRELSLADVLDYLTTPPEDQGISPG